MNTNMRRSLLAALVVPALALPAAAQAQGIAPNVGWVGANQYGEYGDWNVGMLYRNGWSAEQMIGANVRGPYGEEIGEVKDIIVGRNGMISEVVVEVGGFLEMGDQHIGVPWRDVTIGPAMQYVQVPLREVESGTYSLYGRVPQGENVWGAPGSWRVGELIGDYAGLVDYPRYGLVTDVIFSPEGRARGVVVNRTAGPWGAPGWYAYPYFTEYNPNWAYYRLPYRTADLGDWGRFDYGQFAQTSPYAGLDEDWARRQQVMLR